MLSKSGLFKSKPKLFLIVSRANEDGSFSPVHQTSGVSSNNPYWEEFMIKESTLCNGDIDRTLLLQVKQHKNNGSHIMLGECTTTLREISTGLSNFPLYLPDLPTNSRKTIGKIGKDSIMSVVRVSVEEPATFLDYIAGGTEINLVVAIDFTGSNGDPRIPKSLHYTGGRKYNDYQRAINSVGRILEGYDYDKLFPVYGFGAKFNGILSHAYPLNNNLSNPEVEGVDGILAAYSEAMKSIQLFGPTNFAPIINQIADKIKMELAVGNNSIYYILLIITDGVITDMDSTVRAIVNASVLPLSIIIVGVGNADFTNMKILDADDEPLVTQQANYQTGRPAIKMDRDIVQFVAMRDFQTETAHYYLPKAVLEEIPDQFMGYMKKHKIPPKSVKRTSHGSVVNVGFIGVPDEPPPAYTT